MSTLASAEQARNQQEVGNTPLIKLTHLLPDCPFTIYAKLEFANPTGSMKDRAALSMITAAVEAGRLSPGSTVVESSSGNLGVALAKACQDFDLHFVCVVDERTNTENIRLIEQFGARVIKVTATQHKGENLLAARLSAVQEFLRNNPDSYWPDQYHNPLNPQGYQEMMREIDKTLDGQVDMLFCATGTCGTIRGCKDYIDTQKMKTAIVAVDAEGSIIFGGKSKPRLLPGHGSSQTSSFFTPSMAQQIYHISDEEAVEGCRSLLRSEGIKAGGSSGAIISALIKSSAKIPKGSNVVIIIGDSGARYANTIYNDTWVNNNLREHAINA